MPDTRRIKIAIDVESEFNSTAGQVFINALVKAMQGSFAAGTLASSWGHEIRVDVVWPNKRPKIEDNTSKLDSEQNKLLEED